MSQLQFPLSTVLPTIRGVWSTHSCLLAALVSFYGCDDALAPKPVPGSKEFISTYTCGSQPIAEAGQELKADMS